MHNDHPVQQTDQPEADPISLLLRLRAECLRIAQGLDDLAKPGATNRPTAAAFARRMRDAAMAPDMVRSCERGAAGVGSHGPSIEIDVIGGNCPVEAGGMIDGAPFYFRARGEKWSLSIGIDPLGQPEWQHEEWFADFPDAGWMTVHEAETFLRYAAHRYASGQPGAKLEDDPDRVQRSKAAREARYRKAQA